MAENGQAQEVVTESRMSMWKQMGKTEDWWAIWLAGLFFVFVTICIFIWNPPVQELPEYRAVMNKEMEEAGFRTIAYTEAEKKIERDQSQK